MMNISKNLHHKEPLTQIQISIKHKATPSLHANGIVSRDINNKGVRILLRLDEEWKEGGEYVVRKVCGGAAWVKSKEPMLRHTPHKMLWLLSKHKATTFQASGIVSRDMDSGDVTMWGVGCFATGVFEHRLMIIMMVAVQKNYVCIIRVLEWFRLVRTGGWGLLFS